MFVAYVLFPETGVQQPTPQVSHPFTQTRTHRTPRRGFHVILGFTGKWYRVSWDVPSDWRIVNRQGPPKAPGVAWWQSRIPFILPSPWQHARALYLHKGAFFYQKDKKRRTLRQKRKRGERASPPLFLFPPASILFAFQERVAWHTTPLFFRFVFVRVEATRKFMIRSLCCISIKTHHHMRLSPIVAQKQVSISMISDERNNCPEYNRILLYKNGNVVIVDVIKKI